MLCSTWGKVGKANKILSQRKQRPLLLFLLCRSESSASSSSRSSLQFGHSLPSCGFVPVSRNQSRSHTTSSSSSSSSLFTMSHSETSSGDPYASFVPLEDTSWFRQSERRQQALQKCVPPLAPDGHKGSSGRIGVLGGSRTFTGAPFYASMAALKVGADLAFCFCAEEASIPLKCYSPEFMVAPVYQAADFDVLVKQGKKKGDDEAEVLVQDMVDKVDAMMGRLHALVIGPGLGRCPLVMEATSRIIRKALDANIPLVLDADALYLLSLPEYQDLLQKKTAGGDYPQSLVVLTPNVMERKRLAGMEDRWDPTRVVVVEKGHEDSIRSNIDGAETNLVCNEIGGLKRSGGIGDLLAGTLGTFLAWNDILVKRGDASQSHAPLACWMACSLVKRSTHIAFQEHKRSTTAPDILGKIGATFHDMTSI